MLVVSSLAAFAPAPGLAAYNASKAGVGALRQRAAARGGAPRGRRRARAHMSWIDTPLVQDAKRDLSCVPRAWWTHLPSPLNRTTGRASPASTAFVAAIEQRSRRVYVPGWVGHVAQARMLLASPLGDRRPRCRSAPGAADDGRGGRRLGRSTADAQRRRWRERPEAASSSAGERDPASGGSSGRHADGGTAAVERLRRRAGRARGRGRQRSERSTAHQASAPSPASHAANARSPAAGATSSSGLRRTTSRQTRTCAAASSRVIVAPDEVTDVLAGDRPERSRDRPRPRRARPRAAAGRRLLHRATAPRSEQPTRRGLVERLEAAVGDEHVLDLVRVGRRQGVRQLRPVAERDLPVEHRPGGQLVAADVVGDPDEAAGVQVVEAQREPTAVRRRAATRGTRRRRRSARRPAGRPPPRRGTRPRCRRRPGARRRRSDSAATTSVLHDVGQVAEDVGQVDAGVERRGFRSSMVTRTRESSGVNPSV